VHVVRVVLARGVRDVLGGAVSRLAGVGLLVPGRAMARAVRVRFPLVARVGLLAIVRVRLPRVSRVRLLAGVRVGLPLVTRVRLLPRVRVRLLAFPCVGFAVVAPVAVIVALPVPLAVPLGPGVGLALIRLLSPTLSVRLALVGLL